MKETEGERGSERDRGVNETEGERGSERDRGRERGEGDMGEGERVRQRARE